MPRPRSNIGRRSRSANTARKERLSRTNQKRLDDNERTRVRMSQKRAQELPDQREERLKVSRVAARRRRAVHVSQQRQVNLQRTLTQIQYLNDQASYHQNAFSYEPEIQYTFIKVEDTDILCPNCNTTKFKGKGQDMSCECKKLELSEHEQPKEPLCLVNGTTDDS